MWKDISDIKRKDLIKSINNLEEATQWCQHYGLLPIVMYCDSCDEEMKYYSNIKCFRCNKRQCRIKRSLFSNTIFCNSSIGIENIIFIMYEWSFDTTISKAANEYGISESTVTDWYQKFRNMATFFYFAEINNKIGGPDITIEIDESLLVKNKYRKGRKLSGQRWVFAGIERMNKAHFFIELVENRSRESLISVIRRRILPGTIIMSDSWKAYKDLPKLIPEMNFQHFMVNHSTNFVNPNNHLCHTQSIEAFWSVLKRKLRIKGGTNYVNNIENLMGDIHYKRQFPLCFSSFIEHINKYY